MKKIVGVLFIIISILSVVMLFHKERFEQQTIVNKAEKTEQSSIVSISSSGFNKGTYNVMKELLDKYDGNIFCTRSTGSLQERGIVKYTYLSEDSYYKNFQLSDGRFLTEAEMESDKFLSTQKTKDLNQVGRIAEFGGSNLFEVRTLWSLANSDKLMDGEYVIQLKQARDINDFLRDLNNTPGIRGKLIPSTYDSGGRLPFVWLLAICCFILVC